MAVAGAIQKSSGRPDPKIPPSRGTSVSSIADEPGQCVGTPGAHAKIKHTEIHDNFAVLLAYLSSDGWDLRWLRPDR